MRHQLLFLWLGMCCCSALLTVCCFYLTSNSCIAQESSWNPQVFVFDINRDGDQFTSYGLEQLTDNPAWAYGSPQWSPDGKRIAADGWELTQFSSQSYSATHLFVMKADGTKFQDVGLGAMPDWSSDGTQLVFHTYANTNGSSNQGLAVVNADGTGLEQISDHWGSPRWLANSNRIVSLYSANRIAVLDLRTGKESIVRLPDSYSPQLGFNLSQQGNRICFADHSNLCLAVATLDENMTSQSVRVVVNNQFCGHCSWSPDGTKIVYSSQDDAQAPAHLYIVDLEKPGNPQRIAGLPSTSCSPDWSPDGKRIVFVADIDD